MFSIKSLLAGRSFSSGMFLQRSSSSAFINFFPALRISACAYKIKLKGLRSSRACSDRFFQSSACSFYECWLRCAPTIRGRAQPRGDREFLKCHLQSCNLMLREVDSVVPHQSMRDSMWVGFMSGSGLSDCVGTDCQHAHWNKTPAAESHKVLCPRIFVRGNKGRTRRPLVLETSSSSSFR
jgi:hypothetical protein